MSPALLVGLLVAGHSQAEGLVRAIADGPAIVRETPTGRERLLYVSIETDAAHVMLSEEQGWTREKSTRREYVARTHRVIMLIGDDLADFIPCVRSSPKAPCAMPSQFPLA